MALRVLLADESSTIRKVFQLALQDYAVEVKSVNMGVDVIDVALDFQPDIVFADVLLQKRNGYDVSADVKAHAQLNSTPVVLMWSGFMELDEDKYLASQADAHLEKPFDVNGLRKVIQKLVPKTKTQVLSRFLKTPEVNAEELTQPQAPPPGITNPSPAIALGDLASDGGTGPTSEGFASKPPPLPETHSDESSSTSDWNMDQFTGIDQFQNSEPAFQEVSLPTRPLSAERANDNESALLEDSPEDKAEAGWQAQPLNRFQVPPEQQSRGEVEDAEEDDDLGFEMPEVNYNSQPNTKTEKASAVGAYDNNLEVEAGEDEVTVKWSPERHADDTEPRVTSPKTGPAHAAAPPQMREEKASSHLGSTAPRLSKEELERVIRAQSQELIEEVVWKIVPELAKQLIERELERLLEEKFPSRD
jgi:CheY-like chemotaxis protein